MDSDSEHDVLSLSEQPLDLSLPKSECKQHLSGDRNVTVAVQRGNEEGERIKEGEKADSLEKSERKEQPHFTGGRDMSFAVTGGRNDDEEKQVKEEGVRNKEEENANMDSDSEHDVPSSPEEPLDLSLPKSECKQHLSGDRNVTVAEQRGRNEEGERIKEGEKADSLPKSEWKEQQHITGDRDVTVAVTGGGNDDEEEGEEEEEEEEEEEKEEEEEEGREEHENKEQAGRIYTCHVEDCGKTYKESKDLVTHILWHGRKKPLICPFTECGKQFAYRSHLKRHIRFHVGDKRFECEVCKKRFFRSWNLKIHKRTHTGERPYVCKVCEKGFSDSGDLKRHMRTHTGEKPYQCEICRRSFSLSHNLKKHRRTKHQGPTV